MGAISFQKHIKPLQSNDSSLRCTASNLLASTSIKPQCKETSSLLTITLVGGNNMKEDLQTAYIPFVIIHCHINPSQIEKWNHPPFLKAQIHLLRILAFFPLNLKFPNSLINCLNYYN